MAVLLVEAGLSDDAERDAVHRRPDRRPGDRRRDLRRRNEPELLRQQNEERGENRADAGHDDIGALVGGRIDERSGGRRHDHAGDAADRHHRADEPALPAMREQEHPEKRANSRLHVGHEEVERLKRPDRASAFARR